MTLVYNKFFRAPVLLLVNIHSQNETSISGLYKRMNGTFGCQTYSHISKTVHMLEDIGLIKSERMGRIRVLRMTEAGKDVAKSFMRAMATMSKEIEKKAEDNIFLGFEDVPKDRNDKAVER